MSKLSDKEMEVVKGFCADVRKALGDNVVSITLFGSRARGEGDDESDIDVLFILRATDSDVEDDIIKIAVDYMVDYNLVLAPATYTNKEWNRYKKLGSFFVDNVESEGIAL